MVDTLISKVKAGLDSIKDHRMAGGNLQYSLGDTLMSAFAMFHLKDPSLLVFRQRLEERWANLERVYKIGAVPQDTAMRQALDGVDPLQISQQFAVAHQVLEEQGLWSQRLVLGNYLAISADGTQHYCPSKKACAHCLVKNKRNGQTHYHHQLLAAVQVHPQQATVFPMDLEPIQQQDGSTKNDCEQNAAKRLFPRLAQRLPDGTRGLMLLDALYPSGPCLKLLQEHELSYLATIKDGYVLVQAERLAQQGQLGEHTWKAKGVICKASFAHRLIHSVAHKDLLVNYLHYEERDEPTGKVLYQNAWVTDVPIRSEQLPELVAVARARWKVENETFNTLKNQGYQLEHNFGHGNQYLASVLASLMMLAFFSRSSGSTC